MKRYLCLILSLSLVSPATASAEADMAKGKEKYDQLCATCHGLSGAGDGPVGASLPENMKPMNFKAGEFKYATDAQKFSELLKKGGAAVGLNALMPPQAGLTDGDVENIYAYVLSLKGN